MKTVDGTCKIKTVDLVEMSLYWGRISALKFSLKDSDGNVMGYTDFKVPLSEKVEATILALREALEDCLIEVLFEGVEAPSEEKTDEPPQL